MSQEPTHTDHSRVSVRVSRLAFVSSWGCFSKCKTLTNTPQNLSESREVGTVEAGGRIPEGDLGEVSRLSPGRGEKALAGGLPRNQSPGWRESS